MRFPLDPSRSPYWLAAGGFLLFFPHFETDQAVILDAQPLHKLPVILILNRRNSLTISSNFFWPVSIQYKTTYMHGVFPKRCSRYKKFYTHPVAERPDRGLLDFAVIAREVDLSKYNYLEIPPGLRAAIDPARRTMRKSHALFNAEPGFVPVFAASPSGKGK